MDDAVHPCHQVDMRFGYSSLGRGNLRAAKGCSLFPGCPWPRLCPYVSIHSMLHLIAKETLF